ncbi:MAG: cellulose biosynthesis protein BcsS [Pseudomonadota bacterium]
MTAIRSRLRAVVMIAAAVCTGNAFCASPSGVFIAGTQYSADSSYTYAGVVKPMAGNELGRGWYNTAILSWLTYRYDTTDATGTDVQIHASSPGLEAGIGYGWKDAGHALTLSTSLGYRNTRVRPFVPADEKSGSVITITPQLQLSVTLTPRLSANTLASYAFGQKSAYARGRLMWMADRRWSVGLQETFQKGQNYRSLQHGLVLVHDLENGYVVEGSAGISRPRDGDDSGYIAFGLSRAF